MDDIRDWLLAFGPTLLSKALGMVPRGKYGMIIGHVYKMLAHLVPYEDGLEELRSHIEEVEIEINPADLKIDTYRSQGAGGQNVNKTESAVRITHIPTGIVAASQVERSQIQNREIAMNLLKARLYAAKKAEQDEKLGNERRLKVGTGERSEKIRTYNYPQNRVTDHRIGFTIQKLDRVINGDLDEILDALVNADQEDKMAQEAKKYND